MAGLTKRDEITRNEIEDSVGETTWGYATVNVSQDQIVFKANNDSAIVQLGGTVEVDILANDTGTDLMITSVDSPSNGTATIVGNTIKYTPNDGYVGSDSFWYDIKDSSGAMTAALIYVDVCGTCSSD